jgi:hypothetical protein
MSVFPFFAVIVVVTFFEWDHERMDKIEELAGRFSQVDKQMELSVRND